MKKILAMVLVVALTAAVSIAGTMAYLTSTDSDVNVMTMGNVKIEQLEYERVVKDGAWVSTNETDKYGYTPDLLQPFTQAKSLLPAVFADGDIKWDDRNSSQNASGATGHQQSWGQVGASGSNQLFDDSVKNVQDKFVFVKNTGSSNAYVRTWIAFEQGKVAADDFADIIKTNGNAIHWSWETVATDVVIGGNEYVVCCVTYKGPTSNPTGILAPNATTYPSLLQVYMTPAATNADVAAIDGNGNGMYDILVFSQAVQVEGFADASTALTAAFGINHPWTEAKIPEVVDNAEELAAALASGATEVILNKGSYTMPTTTGEVAIHGDKDTVISGNNATADKVTLNGVTVQSTGAAYTGIKHSEEVVYNNVTIVGNMYLYAKNVVFNNCTFDLSKTNDYVWIYGATNVEFNNCTFNTMGKAILVFQDGSKVDQTVKVEGCTFNASAPAYNYDKTIHIAAVSIDGSQGGTYNVILNNNTVDSDFNGLWQDKTSAGNITVTVDGTEVLTATK